MPDELKPNTGCWIKRLKLSASVNHPSSIQIAKNNQPLTQVLNDAIKRNNPPHVFRDGMDRNRPVEFGNQRTRMNKGEWTMSTASERRRFPRRTALFAAKYTIESRTYRDSVKNVSAGGIYIGTWRTIKPGQRISLRFPVFAFDRSPSIMGTVVRAQDKGFAVMFDRPIEKQMAWNDVHQ